MFGSNCDEKLAESTEGLPLKQQKWTKLFCTDSDSQIFHFRTLNLCDWSSFVAAVFLSQAFLKMTGQRGSATSRRKQFIASCAFDPIGNNATKINCLKTKPGSTPLSWNYLELNSRVIAIQNKLRQKSYLMITIFKNYTFSRSFLNSLSGRTSDEVPKEGGLSKSGSSKEDWESWNENIAKILKIR